MKMQEIDNTPEYENNRFSYETPELTAFSAPDQLGIVAGASDCTPSMYLEDGFNF